MERERCTHLFLHRFGLTDLGRLTVATSRKGCISAVISSSKCLRNGSAAAAAGESVAVADADIDADAEAAELPPLNHPPIQPDLPWWA